MRTTKLYVGSIPSTVTEAETTKYFQSIEPLAVFKLVASFKSTEKAKNYGFLTIPSESVSRILSTPHYSRGQKLVCEAHLGETTLDDPNQLDLMQRRLFMRNLKRTLTEDDIEVFFSKFGALESVAIVRSHVSGKSRSFGYVTFRDAVVAAQVLQAGQYDIDGVTVYMNKYSKTENALKNGGSKSPQDDHQETQLKSQSLLKQSTQSLEHMVPHHSAPTGLVARSSSKIQAAGKTAPKSQFQKQSQLDVSGLVGSDDFKQPLKSLAERPATSGLITTAAPPIQFLDELYGLSRVVRKLDHLGTNLRFNINLGDSSNRSLRMDH